MDTYMYTCRSTCWNKIKQLLNSKGDAGYFLIDSIEIKYALFIDETFNSHFTNLGPTLAKKSSIPKCLTLHLVH